MEFNDPWSPGDPAGQLLRQYQEQKGGLLFRKVNPCYLPRGSRRRFTNLRISDPSNGLEGEAHNYTEDNRDQIQQLVSQRPTEVIEAIPWGFNAFGRVLGKAHAIERSWNPENLQRTLLVNNTKAGAPYYPSENRDHAAHDVFDEYDIKIVVLE